MTVPQVGMFIWQRLGKILPVGKRWWDIRVFLSKKKKKKNRKKEKEKSSYEFILSCFFPFSALWFTEVLGHI